MRRFIALVVGLFVAAAVAADEAAWRFDGKDVEGWQLGARTANLRVAEGALRFEITGVDPWITSPLIDIDVTAGTRVIIRMSSEDGERGQLYWQALGDDGVTLPYGEGRVVRFAAVSDGKMHEYHLLPSWKGKVKQIRFDPPGERGSVAIESIRIQTVEIPLAKELRCEFTAEEAEQWIPLGMRFLGVEDGILNAVVDYTGRIGATLKGVGLIQSNEEGSGLTRPNLQLDAKKQTNVAVRMSVTEGTLACIQWYSDLDPHSHGSWQDFFIKGDGQSHTYNIELENHPTWKGTINRLVLIVNSSAGTKVGIDYLRVGQHPEGPPRLGIGYLSTERVLYKEGEDPKVRCLVTNDGGTEVKDIEAIIQAVTEEGYEQTAQAPALASGQAFEARWTLSAATPLVVFLEGRAVYEGGPHPSGTCPLIVTGPRDESMIVGNDRVRLVFTKNPFGYGPAFLEMKKGSAWKQCGVLPALGEITHKSRKGETIQRLIFGEGTKGKFTSTFEDVDGVTWSAEAKFAPSEDQPWINAEYSISANADREVIAFRGPILYAGEGAFGAKKDAALFPGLEWLIKGENSSSWLDATPPRSNRWAPDPYKVTIPLMAVLSERMLVGIMWNALDPWDGENNCVTPHFLSPNFRDAQSNHRMSLFVPSIPEWVVENSLDAARPYPLRKGKKLKITCYLFAEESDDVLQAVKNWFAVYGVPALQKESRSYEDELDLCMEYFNSRWDEQEKCWLSWRNRKTGPGWLMGLYTSYLDNARDGAIARRSREILNTVMKMYEASPQRPFAAATTQRTWPISELPFRFGRLAESLAAVERNYSGKGRPGIQSGIELQRGDGSWGFTPTSESRKLLGKEGESASGICARAALPILTYARLTGDARFTKSGLKALTCLNRFTVPRAAQVWEVPVHTPDILAAAYVLMCYLEGYKITGKQEFLDKAIRWGYAGLPFVYAWGVEDRPVMPFAGIAVYGCSFYVRNCWIGRPVHWCALDYAGSLQELAKYDKSFPWRHIAEGIARSGMCQQSDEGEFKGRYPDSWILRTNERSWQAMLDPVLIMQNVLMLTNRMKVPETEILRSGGNDIRVTAVGEVRKLTSDKGVLSFELAESPYEISHLMIAGLKKAQAVKKDGALLTQAKDTDAVAEGWEVIPGSEILCLKVKVGKAPTTIQVKGEAKGSLLP